MDESQDNVLESLRNTEEERSRRKQTMAERDYKPELEFLDGGMVVDGEVPTDERYYGKKVAHALNNPADRVNTTPACFEDRKDGTVLNAYGCVSADDEVCHTSICTNLSEIPWGHMLNFLDTDKGESEHYYKYVHNSPTLVNLVEQIAYLSFTPPQLVFIADYLQRNYVSRGEDGVAEIRSTDRDADHPIPNAIAIGNLLIQEETRTGNQAVRLSEWRSPFEPVPPRE